MTAGQGVSSVMHVVLEPRYSGAEILVRDLVQVHNGGGHQTSIVAFRPSHPDFASEMMALEDVGCRLFIPPNSLAKWARVRWIRAAVRRFQPDIVFAHSILPSLYTRLALRFAKRPSIVTVLHTDDDLADPALLRLERLLWKRNACVVGVNARSVENYQRRMTTRVPVRVIRNGIRLDRFGPAKGTGRETRTRLYGCGQEEVIALQIGRIALQKQQHVSVAALAKLSSRGLGNIRLFLVGPAQDKEYEARVRASAEQGGVADRVVFAGPQGNVAEWLEGADIFLMPSGWEAHSIAALEGIASGLLCVFSGIDAFEEWRSSPGVCIIGAPPSAEELAACLQTVVASRAWECRYYRDLSRFSIQSCAAEYSELIGEFASGASKIRDRAGR